jgi:hypothetical protein
MSTKVLETDLDRFIEANYESGNRDMASFLTAHSHDNMPNFFLVVPKLVARWGGQKAKTKNYESFFEKAEKNEKIIEDKSVFEILVCRIWDEATETCLPVWMGREKHNDIYLNWGFLSAKHGYFIIKKENDIYRPHYLDNKSTNGSSINRTPIEPDREVPLESKSFISLGMSSDLVGISVLNCEDMFKEYLKQ